MGVEDEYTNVSLKELGLKDWLIISVLILMVSFVGALTYQQNNSPINIDQVCSEGYTERAKAQLKHLSPKDREAALYEWASLSGITKTEMEETYPNKDAYCAQVAEFINN